MNVYLRQATQAFRAGRLSEADQLCRQAMINDPGSADVLNLLGAIAGRRGDHQTAAELLRKAVALCPDDPMFRRNLAMALLSMDATDEAAEVAKGLVERDGADVKNLALWATVVSRTGQWDQAIEVLQRAAELDPNSALVHFNLGEAHRRKGNKDEARRHFRRAVELDPNHADAMNNLAGLLLDDGEFLEALQMFEQLLKVRPRSAQAYYNLATALRAAGDLDQALVSLRNAITLDSKFISARYHLANLLTSVGRLDEAESVAEGLREMAPDDPMLKATHAKILERQGRIDEALALIDSLEPQHLQLEGIAITYAVIKEQGGELDEAIEALEKLLASSDTAAIEGIGIRFCLGQFYDKRGDYDRAFENYRLGNENRRKGFIAPFVPENFQRSIEELLTKYSPEGYARCPSSGLETRRPIFIIGMPRSGTSLVEQILASHPEVHGAGELTELRNAVRATYGEKAPPAGGGFEIIDTGQEGGDNYMVPNHWESLSRDDVLQIANRYLAKIGELGGQAARVTDKMPYNFFLAPLIARLFPNAAIIHCRRDPVDTCLSCYFQNFAAGNVYAFDLEHVGTFYRGYERLMDHWREVLGVPMLEMPYEELVADPEPHVRRMLEYCGLDWDVRCLEFHKSKRPVSTASYQQVREPFYTRSAGRAAHYREHLGPLLAALGATDYGTRE